MKRVMYFPSRYIQGPGTIGEIGHYAAPLGDCALVVGGKTALSICGTAIESSLAAAEIDCYQDVFRGVSSRQEVTRLSELARSHGANIIVAVGGGASIDAAKAVAHEMQLPVIVVPTTVATDGPGSALSVLYTEEGAFESYLYLRRNPDCVIMDTAIVAKSPARFLVAGMGDAVAGFWETDTFARSGNTSAFSGGQTPPLAVLALSRLCYQTLLESGHQAKLAVEKQVVTPALEAIVEAITLHSGLDSENGGHAGAHSIHNGLTALPATRQKLHGEKVAFGLLAQLVLEGRPAADIRAVQDFCFTVGLPICLADLNLPEPDPEELRLVAETAVAEGETIHAAWFPVSAAMVEAAILTADALGVDYRQRKTRCD